MCALDFSYGHRSMPAHRYSSRRHKRGARRREEKYDAGGIDFMITFSAATNGASKRRQATKATLYDITRCPKNR